MNSTISKIAPLFAFAAAILTAQAQIDPEPRQILHLGLNQSLHEDGPPGAYAFYYWNMVNTPATNQFLRLAIAPTYVDAELGFKGLLGQNTDLGVGAYGGAFANSYQEVRGGNYYRDESFDGYSGGGNVSIYQTFNPDGRIPLAGVLRQSVTYNSWFDTSDTADNFTRPDSQPIFTSRVGLRWGGKEPVLWPTLAMELSGWYEVDVRTDSGRYGFNGDRPLNHTPQRVFGRALLQLTTPEWKHYIVFGLLGGAAFDSDRLSCFRLGGILPYTKEFPKPIPGYYYNELSVQDLDWLSALMPFPLAAKNRGTFWPGARRPYPSMKKAWDRAAHSIPVWVAASATWRPAVGGKPFPSLGTASRRKGATEAAA